MAIWDEDSRSRDDYMAGVSSEGGSCVHLSCSYFYVQFRATFPPSPIPSQSLEQIVQLKHQEPDGHVCCTVVCKYGVHNQSVEPSCSISSPPLYPSLSWCQGRGVVWVDLIQVDLQEVPLILAQEGQDPKVVHLTPEPEVFQEAHLIQVLEGLRQQLELRVDHPTLELEVFQEALLIQALEVFQEAPPTPELVIVVVFQEAPLIQELEVFQEARLIQELELEVFQEAPPTQELLDLQAFIQVLHRQEANMEM